MAAFLDGRTVSCGSQQLDQYGRMVAACGVNTIDIGDWPVRRGLAIDYAYFSKGRTRSAQDEASKAHAGIWTGSFVEPRQYHRAAARCESGGG